MAWVGAWSQVSLTVYILHGNIIFRENRYLLFLTENSAALEVLKHYLQEALEQNSGSTPKNSTSGSCNVAVDERDGNKDKMMSPFVLFGSSFRKDKEYTQVMKFFVILIIICSSI